ncbi:hypothetical protein BC628DRAFT_185498 [Trametes gibbosa]|nr:hypothetical protein BC628DRAFT_185498 [Trametes gibbosa]
MLSREVTKSLTRFITWTRETSLTRLAFAVHVSRRSMHIYISQRALRFSGSGLGMSDDQPAIKLPNGPTNRENCLAGPLLPPPRLSPRDKPPENRHRHGAYTQQPSLRVGCRGCVLSPAVSVHRVRGAGILLTFVGASHCSGSASSTLRRMAVVMSYPPRSERWTRSGHAQLVAVGVPLH